LTERAWSSGQSNAEDLEPEVCEESRVPYQIKSFGNQWWPKQFGLEAFSFGSRPRYIGTKEEFDQLWTYRSKAGLGRKENIFGLEAIENQVLLLEEFDNTGGKRDWAKGDSAGLPGLCIGIMVSGFQHERCKKVQLKMERRCCGAVEGKMC